MHAHTHTHTQDCSVQEHKVLFFKCQVKPKPAKLCPGGWGVTIRTTTVRKWPRLGSKGPTLLAFSDHPGPPQSPHLSAETCGYYLKPFNKLQAACYSRGTMCESGWGKMPGISVLRLYRALKDMPPLLTRPQPSPGFTIRFRVFLWEGEGRKRDTCFVYNS